ncbi:hypothetical protein [Streptacidiphilus carbonis]|uniref:hypothetical protein n=1 Tax=Streptacidiphilus carbonis TaxID=105422 RepID=UPI0005A86D9B|nr:hypothetical protein [Streptacidiphilus carbonis]
MTELIHFKAPSGHVIAMTLPLHSTIEQQWEHGDLQRVAEDGSPWVEAVEVAEVVEGPSGAPAGDVEAPVRPKAAAKIAEWQEFAVAIGACTADEAAGLTKAQLVELTTPPEMQPPVPEV